jgi:glycosyltransferase involved in cell wall biosynthesis
MRRLLDAKIRQLWPAPATLRKDGVGLAGYANGEFGLGQTMRAHVDSLESAGVAHSVRNVKAGIATRQNEDAMRHRISRRMPYWANVMFVNAALMPALVQEIGSRQLRRHYNVGYWLWELEKFPDAWKSAIDLVDEVWTPTRFVQRGLLAVTSKPVIRIPMPIGFSNPGKMDLARFGIGRDSYVFLCSFDFNSYLSRKNPLGAIEAFRMAFEGSRHDVVLMLKSINGERYPASLAALKDVVASDARIRLHDGFFSRSETLALLNAADTYVSLHRSEGFGLNIAESMYLAKPVIATGYSGNMEFMDAGNSLPVRYALRQLRGGEYPEWHGQHWAEPDLEHAAWLMAGCVDGSLDARSLGGNAARSIRATCTPVACAEAMIQRLAEVGVGDLRGSDNA